MGWFTSCFPKCNPSPRWNSIIPFSSTEYTFAPSFANSAASGRPTTSLRLTTVMTRPWRRFPSGRIRLYTLMYSRI